MIISTISESTPPDQTSHPLTHAKQQHFAPLHTSPTITPYPGSCKPGTLLVTPVCAMAAFTLVASFVCPELIAASVVATYGAAAVWTGFAALAAAVWTGLVAESMLVTALLTIGVALVTALQESGGRGEIQIEFEEEEFEMEIETKNVSKFRGQVH